MCTAGEAIHGVHRWLYRVWALIHSHIEACSEFSSSSPENLSDTCKQLVESATQKAVKQVTIALEERHAFNVAVSEMMILSNTLKDISSSLSPSERQQFLVSHEYHSSLTTLVQLLSPFAPHIASQLWEDLKVAGKLMGVPISEKSVLRQAWPECHEEELVKEEVELVIHVDGRRRESVLVSQEAVESDEAVMHETRRTVAQLGLLAEGQSVNRIVVAPHRRLVIIVTE